MPIPPDVMKCFKYIDSHKNEHIDELRKIVAIPNISSTMPCGQKHVSKLIKWLVERLKNMGFVINLKQPKGHRKDKKPESDIPPLVIGTLGRDSKKKTFLYFCHLDVFKVDEAGWKTDPFQLVKKDDRLYGRGTAKMKGPLLCFIHAVESYQALGIEIPVNIKIIAESMNECESTGLAKCLEDLKTSFLTNVDCAVITDGSWVGRNCPCIMYGCRGVCYFDVTISGANQRLDSGDFGGIVREPMQDAIDIVDHLVDHTQRMKIPHIYDELMHVTPSEEDTYHKLNVNMDEYKADIGVTTLSHDGKQTLMHIWRNTSFNLHYIRPEPPCRGSLDFGIPGKVVIRFSIRTVPRQTADKVCALTKKYIEEVVTKIKTTNKVEVSINSSINPWIENYLHRNYKAAQIALKQVYKEEPNLIRDGNGFQSLTLLSNNLPRTNIIMLPLVDNKANIHKENENIAVRCYTEGTKSLTFIENHSETKWLQYFYLLQMLNRRINQYLIPTSSYKQIKNSEACHCEAFMNKLLEKLHEMNFFFIPTLINISTFMWRTQIGFGGGLMPLGHIKRINLFGHFWNMRKYVLNNCCTTSTLQVSIMYNRLF